MSKLHSFSLLVALAGCSVSDANPAKDVSVDLASVTLADDCGAPPPAAAPAREAPSDAPAGYAPSRRGCEQTSMQLSIKAVAGTKPTTIKVKKVELLDNKGKLLEVLTARAPTQWTGKSYMTWYQTINAGETVSASYPLSAPNWNKLTNGRWNAHGKTFQLRVTMTVGNADRTVEKQSITAAMIEPAVPT